MATVQLRSRVPAEKAEAFVGTKGRPEDFPLVARGGQVTVYKPNGELLLALYPKAITEAAKEKALPFLGRASKQVSKNRGTFLGGQSLYVKGDGTVSNTTQTPPIRTSVHGYFDRNPRFPFCRMTALVSREPEAWAEVFPMVREVAGIFEHGAKGRYVAQLEAAKCTHPAYVIPGTPFTTLTVNGTFAGAYHRDAGDYKPGFGCLSVFRRGAYGGCLLGFPAYGVAVDLEDRDVILFDPHEIHGNTPFVAEGEPHKDFERISVVYYYRAKMSECLAPEKELERVKSSRGALSLGEDDGADGG